MLDQGSGLRWQSSGRRTFWAPAGCGQVFSPYLLFFFTITGILQVEFSFGKRKSPFLYLCISKDLYCIVLTLQSNGSDCILICDVCVTECVLKRRLFMTYMLHRALAVTIITLSNMCLSCPE